MGGGRGHGHGPATWMGTGRIPEPEHPRCHLVAAGRSLEPAPQNPHSTRSRLGTGIQTAPQSERRFDQSADREGEADE